MAEPISFSDLIWPIDSLFFYRHNSLNLRNFDPEICFGGSWELVGTKKISNEYYDLWLRTA